MATGGSCSPSLVVGSTDKISPLLALLEPFDFLFHLQLLVNFTFHQLQVIRSQTVRHETIATEEPTADRSQCKPNFKALATGQHARSFIDRVELLLHVSGVDVRVHATALAFAGLERLVTFDVKNWSIFLQLRLLASEYGLHTVLSFAATDCVALVSRQWRFLHFFVNKPFKIITF